MGFQAAGSKHPSDERCIDHAMRGKCSTRETDRIVAQLAERQHGVVGRWQLLSAGIGRRAIDERMGRRLHGIHRGVYAVGYPTARLESRWMAAVLAGGRSAVLSHRSAAQLWGLAPRSRHPADITRSSYFRPHPQIHAHRGVILDDERTHIEGIPVTTAPRTVLDFAADASRRQVERALNEMEVRGLTDHFSVPDLLERYPRRRGSAVLRVLFSEGSELAGVTQSKFEELFVTVLDDHGLPRPRFNADIAVAGRFYCADCLWSKEGLILELDGRAAHGTRKAFEDDRERDRLLVVAGWRVMHVTWRQLRKEPHVIAADVRRALSRARALR